MYTVNLEESYFPAIGGADVEPVTIGAMLHKAAAEYGDKPALKELKLDSEIGRIWSFNELLRDSEKLARALASRHEKGARIAVWAPNMPEWVLLEFAAAMAGVVLVTVNPSYQRRELKYVLEQSRSEAIYYVEGHRGNPMGEIANAVCDEVSAIRHRILLNDHDALFKGSDIGVLPDTSPEDSVQIQYTSGTTGFPKGALLHHIGLVHNSAAVMERCEITSADILINTMPLFHTTGCSILVLGTVGAGVTMLLAPLFEPNMIANAMERERVTCVLGVPTMIIALLDEVTRNGQDVSSIRRVFSGGAMVAPELVRKSEAVLGTVIQIVYGQTESSPVITATWSNDDMTDLTETIGQPLPHIDVSIRDPQSNAVLPLGEQGEICCRGYLVMKGYNDNPEATASAIDAQGWLHTGDLGRMDARGFVKITGRVKEMIIRGGENLFPAEIENAMLEHDEIADVAVVGVPDEKWGEQVACFLRPVGDAKPDAAKLKAFIRERISPQKTPAYWIYVDEWPLTGSGKVQKFKLREGFERGDYAALTA